MPFKTDGSVHKIGIINEKSICDFIMTKSKVLRAYLCPNNEVVEHKGGTHTKADAIISGEPPKTISIKHHNNGTFDWVNSTMSIPVAIRSALLASIHTIKEQKPSEITRELRATVEDALSTALDKISGADIKSLLRSCYDIYTDYVLITDVKKNRIILFNKEALEELRTYDDCEYSLRRTNKARTSRQIWRRRPDGTEYDTLMRVRLVLNNGVSALFGMGANKSSCPCIKIQQDKIAKFLDNVTDKAVIEDYSLANLP